MLILHFFMKKNHNLLIIISLQLNLLKIHKVNMFYKKNPSFLTILEILIIINIFLLKIIFSFKEHQIKKII